MKRTIPTAILTILVSLNALSKDFSMIPYRVGDKWGYCNEKKEILIKPKFQRTFWFSDDGLAVFKQDGKYGYLNKKGEVHLEAKYDTAYDFSFSYGLVVFEGKRYCISKQGKLELTEAKLAFHCSSGEAESAEEGGGKCSNCCEPFVRNGKVGMVCEEYTYNGGFSLTGSDSVPAIYDTVISPHGYSASFMPLIALKGTKYGIISAQNKVLYDFEYDSISVKSFNVYMLKNSGQWQLCDTNGVLYEGIDNWKSFFYLSGDHFAIEKDGAWGVINKRGEQVLPLEYEAIKLGSRHIIRREFTVKYKGKWGYVSDSGIILAAYDDLEPFNGYKFTAVIKDGKPGYIGIDGVEYFRD